MDYRIMRAASSAASRLPAVSNKNVSRVLSFIVVVFLSSHNQAQWMSEKDHAGSEIFPGEAVAEVGEQDLGAVVGGESGDVAAGM